jgi:glycosyltransferase involved in cell wall biosynthesis
VFVTQNGDWPAFSDRAEYRWFSCDGLICTNPDYLERNRDRWNCALVPNGVDPSRFAPGRGDRSQFGIDTDRPVVLMVSALEENKRVLDGMRAVAALDDVAMVVAGDGPLRSEVDRLAADILPGRFLRLTVDKSRMPELYRCADVFLHTTKAESFGNVYIEALASGLPVVAHDAATTRWILGDQARLVQSGDTPFGLDRDIVPGRHLPMRFMLARVPIGRNVAFTAPKDHQNLSPIDAILPNWVGAGDMSG